MHLFGFIFFLLPRLLLRQRHLSCLKFPVCPDIVSTVIKAVQRVSCSHFSKSNLKKKKKKNFWQSLEWWQERMSYDGDDAPCHRRRGDVCNICKWHSHHCHRLSFVFPKCHCNNSLISCTNILLISTSALQRSKRTNPKVERGFFFLRLLPTLWQTWWSWFPKCN